MIGRTISHYKILEKLGEGGMGVVYKAEDTRLKRTVALKFLPKGLVSHEAERARFLQEAQAASALNHPNVCTIYDIMEADDQHFIVMEYVDGTTLRHILPIRNIQEVILLAIQIGEALHDAHSHGIVHRDVKPENIMVNEKKQIKVMDFGLAKLKGSLKLTRTSSTVGTLAYMAPEHIQGGEVDARGDIFSFGIVLYEMLSGHLPFRGEHEAAMVYSIVNESPVPIEEYRGDIAPELLHILNRALEKDPEDRYQTVHDMVIDLRRLKRETSRVSRAATVRPGNHLETATAPVSVAPSGIRPGGMWLLPSKRTLVLAIAGVVIMCIIAWLLFRPEEPRVVFKAGHASQLTSESGIKLDQVLSPDGRMVAYSAYFKGMLRVHVKQVTGGRTICLTEGMPGYQRIRQWSSDGSEIAFFDLPSGERYVVPALGGAPRKTVHGVWSPDGKHTAFASGDTVYIEPVEGGARKPMSRVFEPNRFAWSPDGSLIAFVSGNAAYLDSEYPGNIAPSSVCVADVSSGAVTAVTDSVSLNVSPAWAADSRHLFFVSDRAGPRDIYCIAVGQTGKPEGSAERLTVGLNVYTISLSADTRSLAYSVLSHSANIWAIRIPQTNWVSIREATQITTGNQLIETVGISPDGQWLVYDSNRPGHQKLFKVLLAGGEPIQLTTDLSDDFCPTWSPDGKRIAYHSFRTGNRDIFVMMNDGTMQQQVTQDPSQDLHPGWSPDGRRLIFTSTKTSQPAIYLTEEKAGTAEWETPRPLASDSGWYPRWSPDGRWIGYLGPNCLRVIPSEGGTSRVLVSTVDPVTGAHPVFLEWSRDSRTVYFKAIDESQRSSFWSIPVEGGKPRLLVKFDEPGRQSSPEFTTDGNRFFFTISKYESDIWKMDLMTEAR